MKYSDEYIEYAMTHPYCELIDCGAPACKPHHIKSRGAGGTDDKNNMLSLCLFHHTGGSESVHVMGWRTFANNHPEVKAKMYSAMKEDMPNE